jgi:hypothetical protein
MGDLDALARAVAPLVAELAARPMYVTQRTVPSVLGMPRKTYLDHCRAGTWPSLKDRRLVYSKTEDVAAFVAAHPAPHPHDVESRALSRASVLDARGNDARQRADAALRLRSKYIRYIYTNRLERGACAPLPLRPQGHPGRT